jgi:hypothetical protein
MQTLKEQGLQITYIWIFVQARSVIFFLFHHTSTKMENIQCNSDEALILKKLVAEELEQKRINLDVCHVTLTEILKESGEKEPEKKIRHQDVFEKFFNSQGCGSKSAERVEAFKQHIEKFSVLFSEETPIMEGLVVNVCVVRDVYSDKCKARTIVFVHNYDNVIIIENPYAFFMYAPLDWSWKRHESIELHTSLDKFNAQHENNIRLQSKKGKDGHEWIIMQDISSNELIKKKANKVLLSEDSYFNIVQNNHIRLDIDKCTSLTCAINSMVDSIKTLTKQEVVKKCAGCKFPKNKKAKMWRCTKSRELVDLHLQSYRLKAVSKYSKSHFFDAFQKVNKFIDTELAEVIMDELENSEKMLQITTAVYNGY